MSAKENMQDSLSKYKASLHSLGVYRNLLNDTVISSLKDMVDCVFDYVYFNKGDIYQVIDRYGRFYHELSHGDTLSTFCFLDEYIIRQVIYDENVFTKTAEHIKYPELSSQLKKAAYADLFNLSVISAISSRIIKESICSKLTTDSFEYEFINNLPDWSSSLGDETPKSSNPIANSKIVPDTVKNRSKDAVTIMIEKLSVLLNAGQYERCLKELSDFHYNNGSGIFTQYKAFIWTRGNNGTGYFKGIRYIDNIRLSDLVEYEVEREIVIENTLKFLNGYRANNVLLYGDRGTGKSSTVKAILNEYHDRGLRIIELPKNHLYDFPQIVSLLEGRKNKFIIFIDDLSFDDNEQSYTALKAALEGTLAERPKNVVIYATSNRRHLIKERFSDRTGLSSVDENEEIHAADTLQEKLSLADRFGITVVFSSPDKKKYLRIVDHLASQYGISMDKDTLHSEALKWEINYNGRSPRTARQFIEWLAGKVTNK